MSTGPGEPQALNAKHIPSPWAGKRGSGSWSPSALFCILRRTRYVGALEWNRMEKTYRKGTKVRVERDAHEVIRVEAPHLRIVSDELWAAAHAQMQEKRSRSTTPIASKKAGRPPVYLLSGLVKCSVCGGSLTVVNSRDGATPIKVYVCSFRRDRGESVCKNSHGRPVEKLDAGVLNWVNSNILSEELVLDALKSLRRRMIEKSRTTTRELPRLESEAAKLKAQVANLVDILASTPKANASALIAGLNERQDELNALDARLRTIKAAPSAIDLEIRRYEEEARARVAHLQEVLRSTPKQARALLSAIFGGKLTARPLVDRHGPRFVIEGEASVARMLAYEEEQGDGSSEIHPPRLRPQRESNPR